MRKEAIRRQHPDMSDEEVQQAFVAQTDAWRANEDEGIYVEVYGPWPENSVSV